MEVWQSLPHKPALIAHSPQSAIHVFVVAVKYHGKWAERLVFELRKALLFENSKDLCFARLSYRTPKCRRYSGILEGLQG